MYYKTGDYQRSEDLMQDAFGKLWENCKKVSRDKAQSFLFTTASSNLTVDFGYDNNIKQL